MGDLLAGLLTEEQHERMELAREFLNAQRDAPDDVAVSTLEDAGVGLGAE